MYVVINNLQEFNNLLTAINSNHGSNLPGVMSQMISKILSELIF